MAEKKNHVTLEKQVGIKQLNCYYSGKSLTPFAVKSVGFDNNFFLFTSNTVSFLKRHTNGLKHRTSLDKSAVKRI